MKYKGSHSHYMYHVNNNCMQYNFSEILIVIRSSLNGVCISNFDNTVRKIKICLIISDFRIPWTVFRQEFFFKNNIPDASMFQDTGPNPFLWRDKYLKEFDLHIYRFFWYLVKISKPNSPSPAWRSGVFQKWQRACFHLFIHARFVKMDAILNWTYMISTKCFNNIEAIPSFETDFALYFGYYKDQ